MVRSVGEMEGANAVHDLGRGDSVNLLEGVGKRGYVRITDSQRGFAERVFLLDQRERNVEPVFFDVLIRGHIHALLEQANEIVFFQIGDFDQFFKGYILAVIVVDVFQHSVDPRVIHEIDVKILVDKKQRVFEIRFRERAVLVSDRGGIGLICFSEIKEDPCGMVNGRVFCGIYLDQGVHFDGGQGEEIEEGVVDFGVLCKDQLEFQILGEQIDMLFFQFVANIVQQDGDMTAVNIVNAIDTERFEVPIVIFYASSVMISPDVVEHALKKSFHRIEEKTCLDYISDAGIKQGGEPSKRRF